MELELKPYFRRQYVVARLDNGLTREYFCVVLIASARQD